MREDSKQEHGTEYSQASDGPAENQDEDTEKMTESSRADTEDVATDFETGSDSSSDSGNSSGDNSTSETTAPSEETGTVEIGDRKTGKLWKQMATIDLFASPDGSQIYEKLYPGIEGRYDFYIRNTMKEITYMTVTMEEETNSENGGTLPLEYQILNGEGTVISGDWKDATALKAFPVTLRPKENVNYSIRWRWPYETAAGQTADAYDTRLATSKDLIHRLRLVIHIEQ